MPFNERDHLFCVLSDTCEEGLCLIVILTSVKEGRFYDNACVLNAEDHPFLRHPTYALYRLAEIVSADRITRFVEKGYYRLAASFAAPAMKLLTDGLFRSEESRPAIVRYAERRRI